MTKVEGRVDFIDAKPTSTGKTMYKVKVNGVSYGAGLYPPKFKVGDNISFTATMNGNYHNMETRTVTILPASAAPAPMAPRSSGAVGGNQWDTRQDTISKQAALNSALTAVEILVAIGGVPGMAKAKTEADKFQLFAKTLDELRKDYYFQNTGNKLDLPETGLSEPADEEVTKQGGWE